MSSMIRISNQDGVQVNSSKSLLLLVIMILASVFLPRAYASPVAVSINPTTQVVNQGSLGSFSINLANAAKTAYKLKLSGLVPGAGYSFSSNPVSTPPGGGSGAGSSTLTLDTTSTPLYCPGSYSFSVAASNSTSAPTPGDPGDSSSASANLIVIQVGPPIAVTITTDKQAYRIGDTVKMTITTNRPAQGYYTITSPSGTPTTLPLPIYSSNPWTQTLKANTIGHWTIYVQANDFCSGISNASVSFDVTPDTYSVSLSLDGVPSQYGAQVTVDGTQQGAVGGASPSIMQLTFKLDTTHTIVLDQYIQGDTGVRYFTSQNSWSVNSAASHTFEYETQYLVTVSTDPAGITDVTGGDWYKAGTSVQTNEVPTTVSGTAGTQYAFQGWEVNGVTQSGNGISLVVDKPYNAVAKYVTQYQLVVDSPYGNPKGQGYYDAGSTATFSVTTPSGFPVQQVFVRWEGAYTGTSPTGSVTMDSAKVIHAVWSPSYLLLIIIGIVAVAVVGGLLFWRRRRGPVTETKPVPGEETVQSAEAAGNVTCASCGTENPVDQKFCTECGKKLSHPKKQQA